ncbi:MAG: PQQ-binding-like beta-propeller repeat protein [Chthoniobacteraceae bacterium]
MTRTLLALALATSLVHAADWPQYRGLVGDGSTPDKISAQWPAGGPKVLWKADSALGFSSFAVANARCYTIEGRDIDGIPQEVLVAREAMTGKEKWTAALGVRNYGAKGGDAGAKGNDGGDGPRSTPTVIGNTVVTMNADLAVECFDAASGKSLWKRDIVADHEGRNIQWKNAASPLFEGGLIYVAGGGPGQSLLALDPKTGAVVSKAFDEAITHSTPVASTILGQRQIIYFLKSGLLAVEPKTLKELWRYAFDFKVSTAMSPVVAGDIVYCSAGYGVGAGAVKITRSGTTWKADELYRMRGDKPLANHWSTPVLHDGHLYGMFQFKEYGGGPVKCVDIKDGSVKWEKEGFGPGHVVRVGEHILALSDAGEIVLIAAKPGAYTEVARAKVLDGKCWTTPVVSNGMVFLRSTKQAVCLDLRAGLAAR